jgi:Tfp pilus assembly protein PilZ
MALSERYARHGGIILAAQSSWRLNELITVLDRIMTETDAEDWVGQVRWLNNWAAER